ncbi:MAG: YraN family protein [Patescibacteria group bacterium]|nr:YraN family protein [Patescibacteria group bacterium]MDD4610719.1 YraN family protein [Patescibacteria group bacterium]
MNYKQTVGQFGEMLAKNYLIRKGYQILDSNVKISYKEIDIIAKNGDFTVFIEVKTRTSSIFGEADEAFSSTKMRRFRTAVANYIFENNIDENFVKIDLISVDINKYKKIAKIRHFKDII